MLVFPVKYRSDFLSACKEFGVSPPLAFSVARCESRFSPRKVSPKGAVGVMQLMPSTAKWCCEKNGWEYDYDRLFDPSFNVRVGVYYLSYLQTLFPDSEDVVMAYNAGEGNVRKWMTGLGEPFDETRAYTKRVFSSQRVYRLFF